MLEPWAMLGPGGPRPFHQKKNRSFASPRGIGRRRGEQEGGESSSKIAKLTGEKVGKWASPRGQVRRSDFSGAHSSMPRWRKAPEDSWQARESARSIADRRSVQANWEEENASPRRASVTELATGVAWQ